MGLKFDQLKDYQQKLQTPGSFPDSLWSRINATPAGPAQNPDVAGGEFGPIEITQQQQNPPSNPATTSAPPNTSGAPGSGGAISRSSINNSDYGYDPALGTVNAQTDTVAGQMSGLLSRASPFITRARTAAAQTMNARGGLNTSMAAGAGEAAAIDAALPIATADAGTYSAQRIANQSATNLSRESGSVEANKAYLLQKSGEINSQLENLRAKNISQLSAQEAQQLQALTAQKGAIDQQLQMLVGSQQSALQTERIDAQTSWNTAQQNADMTLQLLRGDQSTALSQIESDNRMLLQTSQAASQRSIYNSQALATIMSNPDTTEAQKQAAVDRQLSLYRSDLSIIGGIGDVDLLKLLDFSTPESTTTPAPTVDLSAIDNSNLLLR
jgi:hypothetical protein